MTTIMKITLSITLLLLLSYPSFGGVKGLTKFFRSRFKSSWVLKDQGVRYADHVCIDMNQVLHHCFRGGTEPKRVFAILYSRIDYIVSVARPRTSLVLAFDGSAPFAKMQTQRVRRKLSPANSLISPGTDLMNTMENAMKVYFLQRLQRSTFRNLTLFVSDPSIPGEGEVKIINWIKNQMPSTDDSVIIYGSDSDLILQASCLHKVDKLKIMQSNFANEDDAFCDVSSLVRGLYNLSFKKIGLNEKDLEDVGDILTDSAKSSISGIGLNDSSNNSINSTNNKIYYVKKNNSVSPSDVTLETFRVDLVILAILQGNDYLPKLRGTSMIRALLAYEKVMIMLPENERFIFNASSDTFNFKALWLILKYQPKDTAVALPYQPPMVVQEFHNFVLRVFDILPTSINWVYIDEGLPAKDGADLPSWKASIKLNGTVFETENCYTRKREARAALADQILKTLDPDMYSAMNEKKLVISKQLKELREDVETDNEILKLSWTKTNITEVVNISADEESTVEEWSNSISSEFLNKIMSNETDIYFNANSSVFSRLNSHFEDDVDTQEEILDSLDDTSINAASDIDENRNSIFEIDDDIDEENSDDEVAFSDSKVSAEEYLKYLKDGDVSMYLNGILWVVRMYLDGRCPDVSYTYMGRPPMTPLAIRTYLENCAFAASNGNIIIENDDSNFLSSRHQMNESTALEIFGRKDVQEFFASRIYVPTSKLKPLSASSTCISIIPKASTDSIPVNLRVPWKLLQEDFFDKLEDTGLKKTGYTNLIRSLEKCLKKSVGFESGDVALARVEGTMSELNRNELISNISVSEELKFRQKNRRRLPRSLRKDRAKGKLLKKWRSISGEMTDNLNNFDYCDIDSGELVGAEEFDDYEEYDEGSEDGLVIEVINSSILPSMNNSSDNLNSFSDSGKQKSFSYEMFPTIPVLRVQRPVKTPALEVFSKSDYEDWLVLTTVNDLKEIGFRAFYRRQRFKLSSTEQTFNIPRVLPKGLKSFRAVKYQRYLDPAAPIKQAKIKRSPDKVTESSNVKTVEKNIVKREPDSDDELLHKKSRGRKQRTSVENKNGFLRRNRK